jgi:hypothetical protein
VQTSAQLASQLVRRERSHKPPELPSHPLHAVIRGPHHERGDPRSLRGIELLARKDDKTRFFA